MIKKAILHCDACWETWEGSESSVGYPCMFDGGVVRRATLREAEDYCDAISKGWVN